MCSRQEKILEEYEFWNRTKIKCMNVKSLLIIAATLGSCINEPKIIIKKIENDDISIKWFYYSYISNNSPQYILVAKDGKEKIILEAESLITNVILNKNYIIIKIGDLHYGSIVTNPIDKKIFGYNILIDSTGTNEERMSVSNGEPESTW